ncbi:magnesium transporter [Vallitalea sp.]|jgi:magnesium transporter|uniref:magnesium transporter n=1 Tax=Vallitalea sp. TaxID=1882829 RepID=UPI0025DEB172|nr:magnesium transporter [Vallitalea sp.]MCT4687043.1 magnesium transporter [Vallitalea sp.]
MDLKTLRELLKEKQLTKIRNELSVLQEADIAELLEDIEIKESLLIFRLLPKEIAAEVFSFFDVERQSEISSLVSDKELADIINELNFDDKIDLIEEVPANLVNRILQHSTVVERRLINEFLNYPEDSAGSLMTIEFVGLNKEMTVNEAMDKIRRIGLDKETIYTSYVTGSKRTLEGIISLKDLVLSDKETVISNIMETGFISVNTHADQEYIAEVFKKYNFLSLPVVDNENRLVGIITIDDIVDVIEEETTEDFQRMAAIEPTEIEYLDASVLVLAKKRLPWLIVLMFSAYLTEMVMNYNNSLIIQFALAIYTPMLMSTGGNAGAQSATLVIRSITLGEIKFMDFFRVLWKEIRVGLMVGTTLGIMNCIRIYLTDGEVSKAIMVGLTLICTTTFAAIIGGTLPIVAKKLRLDPAIMASPMITTIVDVTTLLIFFRVASLILS